MKKFTMELVWHNCHGYPPSESRNDNLYITNGHWVHRAEYSIEDGWYDFRTGDYLPFELLWKYWWADMEQTVQGEPRFKSSIVDDLDDLVEDYKRHINRNLNISKCINDALDNNI